MDLLLAHPAPFVMEERQASATAGVTLSSGVIAVRAKAARRSGC